MAKNIHLQRVRNDLEPRREPYWGAPLEQGRYLGVRKLDDGTCTWIARLRDDDGKQRYRSLGQVTKGFDHSHAKKAAESWFADLDADIDDTPPTVADVCREYVADLQAEGRHKAAHDADLRFKRLVYDADIGKVLVEKLKTARIKEWRNNIDVGLSAQNRSLTALKAALNMAVTHSRVNPSVAQQWKAVKRHTNADGRRDIFLDIGQRRTLLEHCSGDFRDFVQAAMLTGARSGELANLKRSHFDERNGIVTFTGKTGTRTIPLSPPAVALFRRLSKGKLPEAYLLSHGGKQWEKWDWGELMRTARSKAKLPSGVVMYTLRHSWITDAVTGGLTTLDVAKLTGTSLEMIEKHYGHLVLTSVKARLAKIDFL